MPPDIMETYMGSVSNKNRSHDVHGVSSPSAMRHRERLVIAHWTGRERPSTARPDDR
jgi:hypothetical protein